jgi:hypothetical protein
MSDQAQAVSKELKKEIRTLFGKLTKPKDIAKASDYEASLQNTKEDIANVRF